MAVRLATGRNGWDIIELYVRRSIRAAGYALSPSIIDDVIFASCFDDGVFNLFAVNQRLHDNGAKIIPPV